MSASRTIRVYFASSYRDMKAERELLSTTVFPLIKSRCEERGLALELVDLRASAASEFEALSSVATGFADEIDRCRPYFIGLLGDRCSGSADIPEAVYTRLPWLKDEVAAGKPLLELEFLHGALRSPTGSQARFYLRDPAYAASTANAALLPADLRETQDTLRIKDAVRRSGLPVIENYANPAALCAQIAADLTRAVDSIVSNAPATMQLSPAQLEQLLSASSPEPSGAATSQEADPGDVAPTHTPSPAGASETPPAAVTGRRVRIVHLSGSRARTTQEFNLDSQDEVWIGRDPVSHVRYTEGDQTVSRAHMKIVTSFGDPNAYILVARGRNGTLVNNTEVSGSEGLRDGDIVQVGRGGPAFRFEQYPKMAAQAGWQEAEPPPIVAAELLAVEPGRKAGATTVLTYDPAIAKAMLEAAKKPAPVTPLLMEETEAIVFTPLGKTGGNNAARRFRMIVAAGIAVLVIGLIVSLIFRKR
jgi:hypothetical protein